MDKTSSMYLFVKLNWDANRFLPVESKDCMNSDDRSTAIMKSLHKINEIAQMWY